MRLPKRVQIVEVGPRDGLQSEERILPTATKLALIDRLADAGHTIIEATSFVSPKFVPQLADADEVMRGLRRRPGIRYPVLVPNERGFDRALAAGVDEIAVFGSASETYSRKNLNHGRDEAIEMFRPVVRRAKDAGLRVRAYLSMAFGDPWEGPIPARVAADGALRLVDLGADELSFGDSIGVATIGATQALITECVERGVGPERIGVHFHDTYGQALANVLAALELGVTTIDASLGGIGGSVVDTGAGGNLATEDLVYMLDGVGVETGVDAKKVAAVSSWLAGELGHAMPGRGARALSGRIA